MIQAIYIWCENVRRNILHLITIPSIPVLSIVSLPYIDNSFCIILTDNSLLINNAPDGIKHKPSEQLISVKHPISANIDDRLHYYQQGFSFIDIAMSIESLPYIVNIKIQGRFLLLIEIIVAYFEISPILWTLSCIFHLERKYINHMKRNMNVLETISPCAINHSDDKFVFASEDCLHVISSVPIGGRITNTPQATNCSLTRQENQNHGAHLLRVTATYIVEFCYNYRLLQHDLFAKSCPKKRPKHFNKD